MLQYCAGFDPLIYSSLVNTVYLKYEHKGKANPGWILNTATYSV